MKRRDLSVTIALCVSLAVHAMILLALAAVEVHELSRSLHHPAPDLHALLALRPRSATPDRPMIAPPPADPVDYEELFGERGSKGAAANSSPGDQPMEAPQGSQEQAALTPRPGLPNSAAGQSNPSSGGAAASGANETTPRPPAAVATPFGPPPDPAAPFGVSLATDSVSPPLKTAKKPTSAVSAQPPPKAQPATRPLVALASAADSAAAHVSDATPPTTAAAAAAQASRGPAGEAGNKSESESDPFVTRPTFTWHNGKLEARDGRKVKTVRPKLTDAGEVAVATLESPMVSFVVSIDDAGKVIGVDYLHHSGSNEIDLPAYRAMFEWEFEPTKDKRGVAVPDAVIVTLRWQ
jgi:hypothetical protein